jgi:hypothetical protein
MSNSTEYSPLSLLMIPSTGQQLAFDTTILAGQLVPSSICNTQLYPRRLSDRQWRIIQQLILPRNQEDGYASWRWTGAASACVRPTNPRRCGLRPRHRQGLCSPHRPEPRRTYPKRVKPGFSTVMDCAQDAGDGSLRWIGLQDKGSGP